MVIIQYNRRNLRKFLNYLRDRYTFLEISYEVNMDAMTLCKLSVYVNFNRNHDYRGLWDSLKETYSEEYAKFCSEGILISHIVVYNKKILTRDVVIRGRER